MSLINPFGYHILLFPFNLISNNYLMDHVTEFLSPNFHEQITFKYLLLLLLALCAASRKNLNLIEIGLILLFMNMALYSVRCIPLFAIIAAPIIIRHADLLLNSCQNRIAAYFKLKSEKIAAVDASGKRDRMVGCSRRSCRGLCSIGKIDFKFNPDTKPVAAVEFLKKENIKGNVFNNDEFGDYVIYKCSAQYKVFIDGRLDMYGEERVKEYHKVAGFQVGWEGILDKYDIGWILYPADSPLSRFLLGNDKWRLVYADKVANIFVRNTPQYQYLVEKYKK